MKTLAARDPKRRGGSSYRKVTSRRRTQLMSRSMKSSSLIAV